MVSDRMAINRVAHTLMGTRGDLFPFLGVQSFGERSRIDNIGKEDGDRFAFSAEMGGLGAEFILESGGADSWRAARCLGGLAVTGAPLFLQE